MVTNSVNSSSPDCDRAALSIPPQLAKTRQSAWTIEDSEALYRIHAWGEPYFSINAAGHITVSPKGDRGGSLDLFELVEALQLRDLELPLLIRFPNILADRMERLNACFAKAIARYSYGGSYQGVFPVKCNQQRHLIEDLVQFGQADRFGLEAGSKPELIVALAVLDTPGALLICNGYKDREYIEMALLAQRLGRQPIIVIEQLEEVAIAIAVSRELGIRPMLGVRAKLSSQGVGRWGDSIGERAKFGLSIPAILQMVEQLRAVEMLDCLQLLHFHMGSQVSAISAIKDVIREASQIYVELIALGANLHYLDVGGGLAVDYNGAKTKVWASKNYNMQNYANDIVAEIQEACDERQVTPPTILSESGRAIASHQSVLVFNVLGSSEVPASVPVPPTEDDHLILRNLWETYELIDRDNAQETYHDAIQFKGEAISLFNFGYLNLRDRARAEQLYWACCKKILHLLRQQDRIPEDFQDLERIVASIYYINLSIFQSLPDAWAIDQLFPILPIHRLEEEPTERATLADLTCDSDGKIDRFIDQREAKSLLELHPLNPEEPYYLGLFLGGAYQEIMGNLHNLFGDVNTVHIHFTPKGYQVEHLVKGDTMAEVLSYVQYDAEDLIERMRKQSEQALQEERISLQESQRLLQNYTRCLSHYTYLTDRSSS